MFDNYVCGAKSMCVDRNFHDAVATVGKNMLEGDETGIDFTSVICCCGVSLQIHVEIQSLNQIVQNRSCSKTSGSSVILMN